MDSRSSSLQIRQLFACASCSKELRVTLFDIILNISILREHRCQLQGCLCNVFLVRVARARVTRASTSRQWASLGTSFLSDDDQAKSTSLHSPFISLILQHSEVAHADFRGDARTGNALVQKRLLSQEHRENVFAVCASRTSRIDCSRKVTFRVLTSRREYSPTSIFEQAWWRMVIITLRCFRFFLLM